MTKNCPVAIVKKQKPKNIVPSHLKSRRITRTVGQYRFKLNSVDTTVESVSSKKKKAREIQNNLNNRKFDWKRLNEERKSETERKKSIHVYDLTKPILRKSDPVKRVPVLKRLKVSAALIKLNKERSCKSVPVDCHQRACQQSETKHQQTCDAQHGETKTALFLLA